MGIAVKVKKTRFDSLQQEAYLSLWRTYDRLKLIEDETFGQFELSAQQYNSLRILQSISPGTMPTSMLGNKLISRAPDMTRLLDRLEERKLVCRERKSDNRRVVEVGITDSGVRLLEQLTQVVRECHKRQLGHLSEQELKQLLELLHVVRWPHEDADSLWRDNRKQHD